MDVKEANIKFHDGASADYDRKWAIRFDDDISKFVLDKFELAFQGSFPKNVRAMEIGCGTGFVILNLGIAGVLDEAWGCDISQGMLDTCQANADAQARAPQERAPVHGRQGIGQAARQALHKTCRAGAMRRIAVETVRFFREQHEALRKN
jgi:SAM-dependent methyltransferase